MKKEEELFGLIEKIEQNKIQLESYKNELLNNKIDDMTLMVEQIIMLINYLSEVIYLLNVYNIYFLRLSFERTQLESKLNYNFENVLEYIDTNNLNIMRNFISTLFIPLPLIIYNYELYLKIITNVMSIYTISFLLTSSYLVSNFRKKRITKRIDNIDNLIDKYEKNIQILESNKETIGKILEIAIIKINEIVNEQTSNNQEIIKNNNFSIYLIKNDNNIKKRIRK